MSPRAPVHQLAYERLRDMVLFGQLAPGAAVTIEGLAGRLGLGMTPVREALRRLIAEGALHMRDNRRVSVPRLTPETLADLCHARLAVETRLAEKALPRATPGLIAQLRATDARVDAAIAAADVAGYLRYNHEFHFTLYAAAQAEVLEALARALWLRMGPSLRVVCTGPDGLALPDNHKLAVAALVEGDAAALGTAIGADIEQGAAQIRARLLGGLPVDAAAQDDPESG